MRIKELGIGLSAVQFRFHVLHEETMDSATVGGVGVVKMERVINTANIVEKIAKFKCFISRFGATLGQLQLVPRF